MGPGWPALERSSVCKFDSYHLR